jgi:hypothetical protein
MEDYIIYNEMMDVYQQQIGIIQEGEIMDTAMGKDKDESKIVKILKFIPRLIHAIISLIKQKVLDTATNMKMKYIESKLKNSTVTESFYIETPVFEFDKNTKDLQKHSGEFKQFSSKLYNDTQDMMFNMRGLLNMKSGDSIALSANKFHREWNAQKIYMSFLKEIDIWSKRFMKYNTSEGSFNYNQKEGHETKRNVARLLDTFNSLTTTRTNLNQSIVDLNKTERLIHKNDLFIGIGQLENKIQPVLYDMVNDMARCCKCLSAIASRLVHITCVTINSIYQEVKEWLD